jgi:hypothetical protein
MSIGPCQPPNFTTGVVTFTPSEFVSYYPAFDKVSPTSLQTNFNRACLLLDNSCCSRVQNAFERQILLGMLTAHITALTQGEWGNPPQGAVGRVESAAEGSVNASLAYAETTSMTVAWLNSTKYGAEFVAATAKYRTAHYLTPRRPQHVGGILPESAGWGYGPGYGGGGY